jgi:hypothetical protein
MEPQRNYGLAEVYAVLERSSWLAQRLESKDGFFCLRDNCVAELLLQRRKKFVDAEKKFRSTKHAARFLGVLPGVRAVGAVNTLAWWATDAQSDIDLFVVSKRGLVWSTRFWSVLPFALFGRRPSGNQKLEKTRSKKFCFSFFVTEDFLNFEELCIARDHYMCFWMKSVVPILDHTGFFLKMDSANRWVNTRLPNARARFLHSRHSPVELSLLMQPRILESVFRYLQRRRLPSNLRELANKDSRVVISDKILKFHENDRREELRDGFEKRLAQLM